MSCNCVVVIHLQFLISRKLLAAKLSLSAIFSRPEITPSVPE